MDILIEEKKYDIGDWKISEQPPSAVLLQAIAAGPSCIIIQISKMLRLWK